MNQISVSSSGSDILIVDKGAGVQSGLEDAGFARLGGCVLHLGKKNIPKLLHKGVVVLATTTSEQQYLWELERLRGLELEWDLQDDLLDYVDCRLRTEYHLSFLNQLLDPPFERLGQKGNDPC
jgi:hypothetical protein